MRRWLLLLFALLPVQQASAQTRVVSAAPEARSVTVYRDPDRRDGPINAYYPQGFALITEKRRVSLPAGDADIRFEGVADGIIAVSAAVTGLPGGVTQKNRDARLLSPVSLTRGALGRPVHLRRTDPATGRVTEQEAVIRSLPEQGLVVETPDGIEALRCSRLPETLVHDRVADDLSAIPTLTISTHSDSAVEAEVTLTYLATGFDWAADYVARLSPDSRHIDLFAWLTVANRSSVAFPDAQLLAVAGRLDRSSDYRALSALPFEPPFSIDCWPEPSYAADEVMSPLALMAPPPPPPPPPPPAPAMMAESIVVTSRSRIAVQEELGDLKLYRVPMAVTIDPLGQKQVALLHQDSIAVTPLLTARLSARGGEEESGSLRRILRFDNRRDNGAGVPLPAGGLSLFGEGADTSLLIAKGRLADRAVGEKVEIDAGLSGQNQFARSYDARTKRHRITLTNAGSEAIAVELFLIKDDGAHIRAPSARLVRQDGMWLWKLSVPAHGAAELDYRLKAD